METEFDIRKQFNIPWNACFKVCDRAKLSGARIDERYRFVQNYEVDGKQYNEYELFVNKLAWFDIQLNYYSCERFFVDTPRQPDPVQDLDYDVSEGFFAPS